MRAFSQKTDTVVFKGAKKIIVSFSGITSNEAMKLTVQSLMDHGFSVEVANADLGIIRTTQKRIGTFGMQIIDIISKNNQILISSRARTTVLDGTSLGEGDLKEFVPVSYFDRKMIKSIFNEMTKVAISLRFPFVYSD